MSLDTVFKALLLISSLTITPKVFAEELSLATQLSQESPNSDLSLKQQPPSRGGGSNTGSQPPRGGGGNGGGSQPPRGGGNNGGGNQPPHGGGNNGGGNQPPHGGGGNGGGNQPPRGGGNDGDHGHTPPPIPPRGGDHDGDHGHYPPPRGGDHDNDHGHYPPPPPPPRHGDHDNHYPPHHDGGNHYPPHYPPPRYPYPNPYPYPAPHFPRYGACVISSYYDGNGWLFYSLQDGSGRVVASREPSYNQAYTFALQLEAEGYCRGIINGIQLPGQPFPSTYPNDVNDCQIIQERDQFGSLIFTVINQYGNSLYSSNNYFHAQQFSQTSPYCNQ